MNTADRNRSRQGVPGNYHVQSKQLYAVPNKPTAQANQSRSAYACISPKPEVLLSPTHKTSSMKKERRKSSSNSSSPSKLPLSPLSEQWELREQTRQRELEDAKMRVMQMEKTMRWWSDCTANWRDRWSKARTERNAIRDENKRLQQQLDYFTKDSNKLERKSGLCNCTGNTFKSLLISNGAKNENHMPNIIDSNIGALENTVEDMPCNIPTDILVDVSISNTNPRPRPTSVHESSNPGLLEPIKCNSPDLQTGLNENGDLLCLDMSPTLGCGDASSGPTNFELEEKIAQLQIKLEESEKNVELERQSKSLLQSNLSTAEQELSQMKGEYQQLYSLKTSLDEEVSQLKVLQDSKVKNSHTESETSCVQKPTSNAEQDGLTEGTKYATLQSEISLLERKNRKLKSQLHDVLVEQRTRMRDSGLKHEKSREYSELQHSYTRMKKHLQDTLSKLDDANKHVDKYEQDVRQSKTEVDYLKSELHRTKHALDQHANMFQQLKAENKDLKSQVTVLSTHLDGYARVKQVNEARLMDTSMSSLRSFEEHELNVLLNEDKLPLSLDTTSTNSFKDRL